MNLKFLIILKKKIQFINNNELYNYLIEKLLLNLNSSIKKDELFINYILLIKKLSILNEEHLNLIINNIISNLYFKYSNELLSFLIEINNNFLINLNFLNNLFNESPIKFKKRKISKKLILNLYNLIKNKLIINNLFLNENLINIL